jgi:RNA polymerase sigma-70 factor (ECF subfamily)
MVTGTTITVDIHALEDHRQALYKFAMVQLRDESRSEDAVQETLVAAIQGAKNFSGGSSVRTWLIGILKHKIIDHFRKASREQSLDTGDDETQLDDIDALYKEDGHLIEPPCAWANPEDALSQAKFFEVLERCMEGLPKNTARVFMLREVMGTDTDEICRELSITSNNCWVLLYRARMTLRECLQQRWFGEAV